MRNYDIESYTLRMYAIAAETAEDYFAAYIDGNARAADIESILTYLAAQSALIARSYRKQGRMRQCDHMTADNAKWIGQMRMLHNDRILKGELTK